MAFSGSMNETETGFENNYEAFDVYCSWKSDTERVRTKQEAFDAIWRGKDAKLKTVEFPKAEFMARYKTHAPRYDIDEQEYKSESASKTAANAEREKPNTPKMPQWLKLHDYQKEAVNNWAVQNYRGIFDMATGTGKTLTGLSALTRLFEDKKGNICAIILCPYIHLVMQWNEEVSHFNIQPIIAFGSSPQKKWKENLKKAISKRKLYDDRKGFFCLISTIATFKSDFVQSQIRLLKEKQPVLLIADEAHNLGAKNTKKYFAENQFLYRLALSATLERHLDKNGTEFLYDLVKSVLNMG